MNSKLIQILVVVALVIGAFLLGNSMRDEDVGRSSDRSSAHAAAGSKSVRTDDRTGSINRRFSDRDVSTRTNADFKPAVTSEAAKAKLKPGEKLGEGAGDSAEEIFLNEIKWDVIKKAYRLRVDQPENQTKEEAEAYRRLRMSNGMQAMGELMRIIDEYGLDQSRPNVRGRGRVLTRLISLSLPDSRDALTEEETTMLTDSAAAYAVEEARVASMQEATLVMRGAALKQADLRQLTEIAGRLAADADLEVVASVVTQMHHKVPFSAYADRGVARVAMTSRFVKALKLDDAQRAAIAPLLDQYLAAVARIPSDLAVLYAADVLDHHYAAARTQPYAYHPGGKPRFPIAWTQQQKRRGLLAHVDCEARFLNAEAALHEGLRPLLRPEQWTALVALDPNYVVVWTDQPGVR